MEKNTEFGDAESNTLFLFTRHDKALEAMTLCGELEERGRFVKIVEALDDDHTTLKVSS